MYCYPFGSSADPTFSYLGRLTYAASLNNRPSPNSTNIDQQWHNIRPNTGPIWPKGVCVCGGRGTRKSTIIQTSKNKNANAKTHT